MPSNWQSAASSPILSIRADIRALDPKRLAGEQSGGVEERGQGAPFMASIRRSPIALEVDKPKGQHYELDPDFFLEVLGKRMKYSACYWPYGVSTLNEAERPCLPSPAKGRNWKTAWRCWTLAAGGFPGPLGGREVSKMQGPCRFQFKAAGGLHTGTGRTPLPVRSGDGGHEPFPARTPL